MHRSMKDIGRYWAEIGYPPQGSFEAAARKALGDEITVNNLWGVAGKLEERFVQIVSPKLAR